VPLGIAGRVRDEPACLAQEAEGLSSLLVRSQPENGRRFGEFEGQADAVTLKSSQDLHRAFRVTCSKSTMSLNLGNGKLAGLQERPDVAGLLVAEHEVHRPSAFTKAEARLSVRADGLLARAALLYSPPDMQTAAQGEGS